MESSSVSYSEDAVQALITSLCGPLMNKVKLVMVNATKNKLLATNQSLVSVVELVSEHLLPQYCAQNISKGAEINKMHSLVFLLAQKVQQVFNSGVIRTCIDQNWDLKGFRSVLLRILTTLGLEDTKKITDFFDKLIQSQNL
jgi:hypothetical protein